MAHFTGNRGMVFRWRGADWGIMLAGGCFTRLWWLPHTETFSHRWGTRYVNADWLGIHVWFDNTLPMTVGERGVW